MPCLIQRSMHTLLHFSLEGSKQKFNKPGCDHLFCLYRTEKEYPINFNNNAMLFVLFNKKLSKAQHNLETSDQWTHSSDQSPWKHLNLMALMYIYCMYS